MQKLYFYLFILAHNNIISSLASIMTLYISSLLTVLENHVIAY